MNKQQSIHKVNGNRTEKHKNTKNGDGTQHYIDIQAMWWWIVSPFMIFAVFLFIAVNSMYKLLFFIFSSVVIFTVHTNPCVS